VGRLKNIVDLEQMLEKCFAKTPTLMKTLASFIKTTEGKDVQFDKSLTTSKIRKVGLHFFPLIYILKIVVCLSNLGKSQRGRRIGRVSKTPHPLHLHMVY